MAPLRGHIFKPMLVRLAEKSIPEPNSGCLIWLGASNGCGYGTLTLGRSKRAYAHRVSFEMENGPIPVGMQIDHLCRNTFCINPAHLEIVTNQENTKRGRVSALRPARTVCGRGHYLADHSYVDSSGRTQCRACLAIRQSKYRTRA